MFPSLTQDTGWLFDKEPARQNDLPLASDTVADQPANNEPPVQKDPPPAQPPDKDSPPATPVIDITSFNEIWGKKYGREVKDESELKGLFELPKKYSEVETKVKEHETKVSELSKQLEEANKKYEETGKYVNPRDWFANEEMMKINALWKAHPDKDPMVMSKITTIKDLKASDPVELLLLKEKYDDPSTFEGMSDEVIKTFIARKYNNVDLADPANWDDVSRIAITKDSNAIRREFAELQKVEVPLPIDVEKLKAGVVEAEKQKYDKAVNVAQAVVSQMINDFKEIVIKDDKGTEMEKYVPEITDSIKSDLNGYVQDLVKAGNDITDPKVVQRVYNQIQKEISHANVKKLVEQVKNRVSVEKDAFWHDQIHNDKDLSGKQRPVGQDNDTQNYIDFIKQGSPRGSY